MGKTANLQHSGHEERSVQNEKAEGGIKSSATVFFRKIAEAFAKTGKALAGFLLPLNAIRVLFLSRSAVTFWAFIFAVTAFILAMLNTADGNRQRIETMERAIRAIQTHLAMPDVPSVDTIDPTTLLIAVQFVTNAAERSTPFDTALAVAIKMTSNHPKLGPLLDELLIEAPGGVSSHDKLRGDYMNQLARFAQDGLISDPGHKTTGSSFQISSYFGLGEPEASEKNRAIIQQLTANLAEDNFAGAVRLIGKLDGKLREGLESWRQKAKRRVAIDDILTELRRSAYLAIMERGT